MWKFYQKLKASASPKDSEPRATLYGNEDGRILTIEREVMKMWEQCFDRHLNGAESTGNRGEYNEVNICVSTVDDGNQPVQTLREVNYAIQQLKNSAQLLIIVFELNLSRWSFVFND